MPMARIVIMSVSSLFPVHAGDRCIMPRSCPAAQSGLMVVGHLLMSYGVPRARTLNLSRGAMPLSETGSPVSGTCAMLRVLKGAGTPSTTRSQHTGGHHEEDAVGLCGGRLRGRVARNHRCTGQRSAAELQDVPWDLYPGQRDRRLCQEGDR